MNVNSLEARKERAFYLTGHAASVLFAMIAAQGATLTAKELADEWVNLSVDNVTAGLNRLAAVGYVKHMGKFAGWQLDTNQLPLDLLWRGHSDVYLPEKAAAQQVLPSGSIASPHQKATINHQPRGFVAPAQPVNHTAAVDNVVDNYGQEGSYVTEKNGISGFLSDQIRSDHDLSKKSGFSVFDQSDLIRVMGILGIYDPKRAELLAADADAATLLTWYFWGEMTHWVKSPLKWAIISTLKPSTSRNKKYDWRRWLPLANWRLLLDDADVDEARYVLATSGRILDGRDVLNELVQVDVPMTLDVAQLIFEMRQAHRGLACLWLIAEEFE